MSEGDFLGATEQLGELQRTANHRPVWERGEPSGLDVGPKIRGVDAAWTGLRGLLHGAGHVASVDDFWDQPEALDGASELLNDVLGERGVHTRTAFARPRLPKNISIELQISFPYAV